MLKTIFEGQIQLWRMDLILFNMIYPYNIYIVHVSCINLLFSLIFLYYLFCKIKILIMKIKFLIKKGNLIAQPILTFLS